MEVPRRLLEAATTDQVTDQLRRCASGQSTGKNGDAFTAFKQASAGRLTVSSVVTWKQLDITQMNSPGAGGERQVISGEDGRFALALLWPQGYLPLLKGCSFVSTKTASCKTATASPATAPGVQVMASSCNSKLINTYGTTFPQTAVIVHTDCESLICLQQTSIVLNISGKASPPSRHTYTDHSQVGQKVKMK